ncbi:hypothetical protein PHMEG_00017764 [Phytophthora megakarya]|uniref:HAT C-terminal dimerisation domain-containing protein n=1 Tax=Phytophthora megakarya TaxID=4795 RepID=A0A225VW09_9STRA|nr:hypothetical protein PHMEG_00017764 [Phytophthora megakarya]
MRQCIGECSCSEEGSGPDDWLCRFNLATQATLREHFDGLAKVQLLMTKLNIIKNRHRIRQLGALMPVLRNVTRWSSTFSMVEMYYKINGVLDHIDDDTLANVIPTARDNIKLKALHEDLKKLESVNKKLQTAIPSTSNGDERLFSRAGIVFSRLHRGMSPTTLENVLFLQHTRSLWDASVVADAIERSNKKQQCSSQNHSIRLYTYPVSVFFRTQPVWILVKSGMRGGRVLGVIPPPESIPRSSSL